MPDSDWPPKQRYAGRILHMIMYGSGSLAGFLTMAHTPETVHRTIPIILADIFAGVVAVIGVLGVVATIVRHWPMEWVMAWLMGGFILAAASIVTAAGTTRALVYGLAAAYLVRAVELWVFSIRTRSARLERMRLWRRVMEEGP